MARTHMIIIQDAEAKWRLDNSKALLFCSLIAFIGALVLIGINNFFDALSQM